MQRRNVAIGDWISNESDEFFIAVMLDSNLSFSEESRTNYFNRKKGAISTTVTPCSPSQSITPIGPLSSTPASQSTFQ